MMKKINVILESAIEFKGIPQVQVAEDLHINPTTLNNYIKGKREPDLETIIRLMMYLDVNLYEFFNNQSNNHDYSISKEEAILLKLFRSMNQENKQTLIDIAKVIKK